MIDVVTISSKGQIVIPRRVREEAGLEKQDKILIMGDGDKIVLEKISKDKVRRKLGKLLNVIDKRFEIDEVEISEEEVQEEINISRHGKEKSSSRH